MPKLKDADRVPDASTVRRWSNGVDGSQPALSLFRQVLVRVAHWLERGNHAHRKPRPVVDNAGSRNPLAFACLRKIPFPTILAWDRRRHPPTLGSGGEKVAVGEDVEKLKRRMPLLDYLQGT